MAGRAGRCGIKPLGAGASNPRGCSRQSVRQWGRQHACSYQKMTCWRSNPLQRTSSVQGSTRSESNWTSCTCGHKEVINKAKADVCRHEPPVALPPGALPPASTGLYVCGRHTCGLWFCTASSRMSCCAERSGTIMQWGRPAHASFGGCEAVVQGQGVGILWLEAADAAHKFPGTAAAPSEHVQQPALQIYPGMYRRRL